MANKEAVFTVKVNTGNSVQDLQNADKAVNKLGQDLQKTQDIAQDTSGTDVMAQRLADLDAKLEAGGLSMRELTKTMKEYQTIAIQAGAESPIGAQALRSAAGLKDEIGDLKAQTKALSSDFVGLDTTMAGVEVGAQAFMGVQSAMALAGIENEELTKTMVKLQAVQGLVNSVTTIANKLNSDSILGIQLRTAWEKIKTGAVLQGTTATTAQATATAVQTSATLASTTATAGLTAGMKLLRLALISTGIGALVVALGAIVAYWDEINSAISGVNGQMKNNINLSKQQIEDAEKDLELLGLQENTLRLQGKSEEEILKMRQDRLRVLAKEQEEDIKIAENKKKLEVTASKRNQKFLSMYIQAQSVAFTWWAYLFTGIIDGVSNGVVFLAKKFNSLAQGFQGLFIDALVMPLEFALEGVNKILKLTGQSTVNVKGLIGGIKGELKSITAESNKFIQKLEGTSLSKDLFKATQDMVADPLSKLLFDPEAVAEESDKAIEQAKTGLIKTQDAIDEITLKQQEKKKESNKNASDDQKKSDDKSLKDLQKHGNDLIAQEEANAEAIRRSKMSALQIELSDIQDEYFEKRTQAEALGAEGVELVAKLKAEEELKKAEVTKKYADAELKALAEQETKRRDRQKLLNGLLLEEHEKALAEINQSTEDSRKELDRRLNSSDENERITKEQHDQAIIALEAKKAKAILELNKKKDEDLKEQAKKKFQEDTEGLMNFMDNAQKGLDVLKGINDIANQIGQQRLDRIETEREADLENLDAKMQAELNAEGLTADQKKAIEEKFAKEKYQVQLQAYNEEEKIKRAQFNRDKMIKIGQIAMDTAVGVTKAVGESPLTFGLPWSAFVAGMGIAQAGVVASQQYKAGKAPTMPSLSGGGGSAGGASASSFTSSNAGGMSTAGLLGQATQTPTTTPATQVYVLESDISQTQNKVKLQESKTSF
jgi:hypothetical protein